MKDELSVSFHVFNRESFEDTMKYWDTVKDHINIENVLKNERVIVEDATALAGPGLYIYLPGKSSIEIPGTATDIMIYDDGCVDLRICGIPVIFKRQDKFLS